LEAAAIRHKADLANLTPTEFVYRSALGQRITASGHQKADPHLVTKVCQLADQVRRLGVVVNQVAAYHHMDVPDRGPVDWSGLPQHIRNAMQDVSDMLLVLVGDQ
jgi:hypothetical protein